MVTYNKSPNGTLIAELTDENIVIASNQEILDLIGDLISFNCKRIIINERNLHPDFFNLKTGLAGEILQKFSNYNLKLAIVGNFRKYESKSFQDLIRECNRGNTILFADSHISAIERMER